MKWISVNDSFPEPVIGTRYLVTDGNMIDIMMYFGMYKDSPEWSSYSGQTFDVTFWMPLPKLPEK